MGVVYRGLDPVSGQAIAIKTVSAIRHRALGAIRSEIRFLRFIKHPGVVGIFDEGLYEGLPWYAMEFLSCVTLKQFNDGLWAHTTGGLLTHTTISRSGVTELHDADFEGATPRSGARPRVEGMGPEELLRVIGVYRRLCDPLSYIHRLGIVHRDLKPNNVFIRDGSPVLTDFGLIDRAFGSQGHEPLGISGKAMGSINYIAPEQVRGEFVDARADLYSLGCMLYESVTSHPPFSGQTADVFAQHLHECPVAPGDLVTGVPAALNDLILALLSKRPGDRPGYADDVADVLVRLGAPAAAYPGAPETTRANYFYRPRTVGRDVILEDLDARRIEAARGQGAMVFLSGESGIGKSAISLEIARRAAANDFSVVTGQCLPVGRGPGEERYSRPLGPLETLLVAIADRCREKGGAYTRRIFGDNIDVLSAIEPGLRDISKVSGAAELRRQDPISGRRRLLKAMREALAAFASENPLFWALEDLQWADDLTTAFLRTLTPDFFVGRAILVVGNYRADEIGAGLRDAVATTSGRVIPIERLDGTAVGQLVADALGMASAPREFASFLTARSQGNPLFVIEYMRVASSRGVLSRQNGRWQIPSDLSRQPRALAELPGTISELIGSQIDAIDASLLPIVQAAAVLGRECEIDVLAATAGVDRETASAAVSRLKERDILDSFSESARFSHDKIRETVYAKVPDASRTELHRSAARALEQVLSAPRDQGAPHAEIATHWAAANVPERACQACLAAGISARAAFANGDALALFQLGIEQARKCGPGRPEIAATFARLVEGAADLHSLAGRQDEARRAFGELLAAGALADPVDLARLHRKMGGAASAVNAYGEAFEAYVRAHAALQGAATAGSPERSPQWWSESIQLGLDQMWCHYWTGDLDQMSSLSARLRTAVEGHATMSQRARYLQSLAILLMRKYRYQITTEAIMNARQAVRIAEQGGLSETALSRFVLGFALLFAGLIQEAEVEMRGALEYAQTLGDVPLQCRCEAYLGVILRRRGDVAAVERSAQRTLAMAGMGRMHDYIGVAQSSLAWAAWRRGSLDDAVKHAHDAIKSWATGGRGGREPLYPFQSLASWILLAIAVPADRLEESLEVAASMLNETQQVLPDPIRGLLEGALDSARQGDGARAREALERSIREATIEVLL